MWIDNELLLDKDTAFTTKKANDTTNTIDLLKSGGANDELVAFVLCTETADSATDTATVQVDLKHSFNGSDWITFGSTGQLAQASVVANTCLLMIRLPKELGRYIKGVVTIGTEALTKGKFTIGLVKDAQTNVVPKAY